MTKEKSVKDDFTTMGIKSAQEIQQKSGVYYEIGQDVCHPGDDGTYELKEIDFTTQTAKIWRPEEGEESAKQFPLSEIYDPHLAESEALRLREEKGKFREVKRSRPL